MNMEGLTAYELIEERELKDMNSHGLLLRHKKTGARVVLMENDDKNKVFMIGFRTPPGDSTGVPHILEHSVLCGSRKFPAKDPFVELVKGSLNTFLNAMTYPDKTVYPIASCNDKDFQNLLHVYLDAVFYPNIYEREEIFRQEGWHYEMEEPDAELAYNGVVYNEMKGVFSSPEDVLDRMTYASLYPETAYGVESGGDPDFIPELTYEEFLRFHKSYYHPSNSYLYLYGDMDMKEKLLWIDREYLSAFDRAEVDSSVGLQKPFEKPVEIAAKYSVTEEESEQNNTYLSYNAVVGTSLDRELYLAFQVLEYALLSAPGAPLKQALLDRRIGKDIISAYENGIYQPYFSVIAKNADTTDKEFFLKTIREVLAGLSENGIDEKALKAGINYFEFQYREADYGSNPKGLMYGLQILDSWLYDDKQPFLHMEELKVFAFLKEQIGSGYFEDLIRRYLLDNPHSSVIIVEPERGLTAKRERELKERLKKFKATLTPEEIGKIVGDTKALRRYQEEPDAPENLKTIPFLKRGDIGKEAEPFQNIVHRVKDTLMLQHNLFTGEIGYLTLLFDVRRVPLDLIPYMGILKSVLGFVDTERYTYADLYNEININSGGINMSMSTYGNVEDREKYGVFFEIKSKALYGKLPFIFEMLREILFTSRLEDGKRLYEIVAMLKSRLQMTMTQAGHSVAVMRALSYGSDTAYFTDLVGGFTFYRLVERLEAHFEEEKNGLIRNLKRLMHCIFRPENLMVDYTADDGGFSALPAEVESFLPLLHRDETELSKAAFQKEVRNEGFKTSAKVQYVAQAGNFMDSGLSYNGALKILRHILGYDYLWNNIRVKGGAYGCMSAFSRLGDGYFVSYRDPNLAKTLEVFAGIPAYIDNFEADEEEMTKYIIGTVSDMDVPLTPSAKGQRSLTAYLNRLTFEEIQSERNQVLSATAADIRALSGHVRAILSQNRLCVLGGEEKIKDQSNLFKTIDNLFL